MKLALVADNAVVVAKSVVNLVAELSHVKDELSARSPAVETYGILVEVSEETN